MTYATKQQMIDRFSSDELAQLTDLVNATTIDDTKLNAALAAADAVINSYVSRRVTTPISPVPQILVEVAGDIAWHRLHRDPPDAVVDRWKTALRWLEKVAKGEVNISDDDGVEAAPADTAKATASAEGRVFSKANMDGYA